MPLILLGYLLFDLLTAAYIVIGYRLYHEWDKYRGTASSDYAERCLYGAIALGIILLLGRFLITPLLSKGRKGEDEPRVDANPKNDFIERPDGSKIHIVYYGREDAQPLIFIHGLNASRDNWYYQRKYFESRYRLILIDLAGMGKSTRPSSKDFSMAKMAADLNAVIEHTGAANAVLWGHSMGGITILTLLATMRRSLTLPIAGIILEHTTYTNPVKTTILSGLFTAIQKPILEPLCWLIILLSPVFWIGRWMSYINGNSQIMTRVMTFAGTQTRRQLDFCAYLSTITPPAVMARCCLGMFRYDVSKELHNITEPTLVIAAHKDIVTRPEASHYLKDHIPAAELFTARPAGHQGLLERHKEVNEAAEKFLQNLKLSSDSTPN